MGGKTFYTPPPSLKGRGYHARRYLLLWLSLCTLLVAAMVVVGGLTRLTESGLSIVEWKPVAGTLPPLTHDAWQEEFEQYRQSPQYQKINKGMSLGDFKNIFWLEYLHRLLGRVIGVAFLLPFLYALAKNYIPSPLKPRLWAIFALGALQGAIGWWMVASGLVDDPRVSPYRLAFHLGTAFVIFGMLWWTVMEIYRHPGESRDPYHNARWIPAFAGMTASWLFTALLFLQILLGALVAGLDAGLTYNTYPLMDGRIVPEGMWLLEPWWKNLFENVTTVQFMHRTLAHLLVLYFVLMYIKARRNKVSDNALRWLHVMAAVLAAQFLLGVATLLSVVAIALASLHQAAALLLFGSSLSLNRALARSGASH